MSEKNKSISSWVGSDNIPVRISKDDCTILCKVHSYKSGEKNEYASYVKDIKDLNGTSFKLIGKSKEISHAKFVCNLELKSMGYNISLLEI